MIPKKLIKVVVYLVIAGLVLSSLVAGGAIFF